MIRPNPEQLRTMNVRSLRETFELGLDEAKKLKLEQQIRDRIASLDDRLTRQVLTDMLQLITDH
jgi:hypothetical protein